MLIIDIYVNLSEDKHVRITRLCMSLIIIFLLIDKNSCKKIFLSKI